MSRLGKDKILIMQPNGSNSVGASKKSTASIFLPLVLITLTIHLILNDYSSNSPSTTITNSLDDDDEQQQQQQLTRITNVPHHQQNHHLNLLLARTEISRLKEEKEFPSNFNKQLKESSSSSSCSSSFSSLLSSTYLSLLKFFKSNNYKGCRSNFGANFFLLAEAASLYQANQDKGIIVLNSTNFNTELIQFRHPFPHIKLIEYYVSFCGICGKFKATYTRLAREIYPWRNVIRPSAIDLGVSNNSPIAHSWSVKVVPTLRIHPPPNPSLAEKLNKQFHSWSLIMQQSELQRSMFSEYNSSQLMIHSLQNVAQYMDKVSLLKADLLHYISRYVHENPNQIPHTWPNLLPVTETSLKDLRSNHPRQELFLLIEGPMQQQVSDSDQSSSISAQAPASASASASASAAPPSLALSVMLELSSSAPWKAIRYVRANENSALIEDVIAQQKIASEQGNNNNNNNNNNQNSNEQVEQLAHFLSNKPIGSNTNTNPNNNIILVYIDDSHSPNRAGRLSPTFRSMTLVTGVDLVSMEQSSLMDEQQSRNSRAKRVILDQVRTTRSVFDTDLNSQLEKLTSERKVELLTQFIKHTYTETNEDREFVNAINDNLKIDGISENSNEFPEKSTKSQMNANNQTAINQDLDSISSDQSTSLFTKLYNLLNPPEKKQKVTTTTTTNFNYNNNNFISSDYDDKLKAIRYMLFTEIPRSSFNDKSVAEQKEKLNTLVNLVSVIKAYFPFPDSSSQQFIDGVQSYLIKQQSRLTLVNNQEQRHSALSFDTIAFKQELKRLESENRRLPEVKEWKHCLNSGYPCALWRLFHTLTAFEYKKLSQIRQPSAIIQSHLPPTTRQQLQQSLSPQAQLPSQYQQPPTSSQPATSLQQQEINLSPSDEAITMKALNSNTSSSSSSSSSSGGGGGGELASPVERLVSTPSTTTSLSLTIATPTLFTTTSDISKNNNNKPFIEADLPMPVILVMRDYVTTFYSCEECKKKFRVEAADLSLERIRHQEPAEFSILWLWETHNRISKRLSMDPDSNQNDTPKVWFPTFEQCSACYKKPPSFLQDTTVDQITMFQESIEWNKPEVICFLLRDYAKHPLVNYSNLFGYQVPYGLGYIMIGSVFCLILILALRCTTYYVERQRRHKATLLNGNGAHYSLALQ